jgi:hypothetical protein
VVNHHFSCVVARRKIKISRYCDAYLSGTKNTALKAEMQAPDEAGTDSMFGP